MKEQETVIITLPAAFSKAHAAIIHKYFQAEDSLTGNEWKTLLKAMDLLR